MADNTHIVLSEPRVIARIVAHMGLDTILTIVHRMDTASKDSGSGPTIIYMGMEMLLICKVRLKSLLIAITIEDDYLREAITHAYTPAIPAAYYGLMSLKQKAILGNYFTKSNMLTADTLKHQYRMSWGNIMGHCKEDGAFARWLLGIGLHDSRSPYSTPSVYLPHLVKNLEAYRMYLLQMQGTSLTIDKGRLSKPYWYDFHDNYGTVLLGDIEVTFDGIAYGQSFVDEVRGLLDAAVGAIHSEPPMCFVET